MKGDIRIKVVDPFGNVSYLVRNVGSGPDFRYFSSSEIPLALSNLTDKAAELRFALRDARTAKQALEAARRLARYTRSVDLA